jgi:diguanylate cyclase (GGDEF)-like protein
MIPSVIRERFLDNRVPRSAFQEFSSDIARYNLRALNQISFVGMIGGILLVIASLPPLHLLQLIEGYAAIALLFTCVFILTATVLRRHENAVLPVYYAFILLVLTIAILMGTWWGKATNATTFVMLVLMLPVLIIDRPYRIHLVFGVMSIAFCLADMNAKSGALLELDLANAVVFYLLSVIICRQTIKAKMSDIIIKHELKQQRDMDILTKLSNRGAFERVVAQYVHESNQNAVLLIMDVDNFKSVNDTMGHAYGDMVLQLVGQYLQNTFRSGDTISRLGGDEFVAFLPAAGDIAYIQEKALALIGQISAIQIESDVPCKIGASIGLAQYPEDGCSFEALYKRADEALYRAKQSGKGDCVIFESV